MTLSARRYTPTIALAALALGAVPWTAFAQNDGDAIARRNCARCHEIASGLKPLLRNAPPAPSFFEIANDPDKYPESKLSAALTEPHAKLPPFGFTTTERRSLIEYIRRQAGR